jgi:hypothetical protein
MTSMLCTGLAATRFCDPPLPRRWFRIDRHRKTRVEVSAQTVLESLQQHLKVTAEAAQRLMEAHAGSSGLLSVGEEWYEAEDRPGDLR